MLPLHYSNIYATRDPFKLRKARDPVISMSKTSPAPGLLISLIGLKHRLYDSTYKRERKYFEFYMKSID